MNESVRPWHFEVAIGMPIVLLAFALFGAIVRRDCLEWWTAIIASMIIVVIIVVWGVAIAVKANATQSHERGAADDAL
jgi:hypothetical protein